MKRVKVITGTNPAKFEQDINLFNKDHKVTHTQFQITNGTSDGNSYPMLGAMLFYDEETSPKPLKDLPFTI